MQPSSPPHPNQRTCPCGAIELAALAAGIINIIVASWSWH
jgi:hypothetical protein